MLWFVLFLTSVLVFFIIKVWMLQTYWKRKGIPYDVPVPFFGFMLDTVIRRKSFFDCINEIYRAHSNLRYVGIYQFTTPVLLLRDPDLIKQICIKDFDTFSEHRPMVPEGTEPIWSNNVFASKAGKWKGIRSTITPTFTSSKMKIMMEIIEERSKQFVNHFINQQIDVIDVELKDILTRYTNDVIASTTFGFQIDSLKDQNNEFYEMAKVFTTFDEHSTYKIFLNGAFPTFMKLFNIKLFSKIATAYFNGFFKHAIKHREDNDIKRPDLLHLLLDARRNAEEKREGKKLNMTDEEIASQVMIFLFGGLDTVSTSLCFAIYELAVHSDIQEKLSQEIEKVWKETEGRPSFENISKIKYLDMIINENLRKNPPMIHVDRQTIRPYTIEPINKNERRLTLKAGAQCLYSIYSIHRDENYFPDPKKFDPERFNDENKYKIIPGTYIPFGVGPRNCIGAKFAILEMKSLLFHLIKNFEVTPNEKTDIPLELWKDRFFFVPKNGFHISFKRRN